MKQIYFAGSISGGRESASDYEMISEELRSWGEVVPEAVFDLDTPRSGEERRASDLFQEDTELIRASDYFVLEASQPSFGVGFQTAQALQGEKPVLALYRRGNPLSAILVGIGVRYEAYVAREDLRSTLQIFFEENR